MKTSIISNPFRIILFAPLIFICHVLEEAPGFVVWMNKLVEKDITQSLFLSVNLTGLIITLILSLLTASTEEKTIAILTLAWLGFLMFANALFHITATIVHQLYSPGTITSIILYLPFILWFSWLLITKARIKSIIIITTILIGALPMAIHGYLIIFEGGRLF